MRVSLDGSLLRRQFLRGLAASAGALSLPQAARAFDIAPAGSRLAADFDPVAAMWLGYDQGHENLTADLAQALWPHVPIRMLVRDHDAESGARELLTKRGLNPDQVRFVHDASALFFMRDSAVFGLDGGGKPFIADFQWTHYGWPAWCRKIFGKGDLHLAECVNSNVPEAGDLDRRFADALGLPVFKSSLAMEGGGLEVNGRGLLIANEELWTSRNPGLTRAVIEKRLKKLPGIRKVVWLPRGLAQDPLHRGTITGRYVGWGTGGHTDEFVRFADGDTVLLAWPDGLEARRHPVARINLARMQANFDILSHSTDQDGKPLQVIKVPLPRTIDRSIVLSADADTAYAAQWTAASFPPAEGRREGDTVLQVATASYLNHVLVDKLVLLPDYLPHGTPAARQEQVRKIYLSAFPGRAVHFIDAVNANWVGGGLHCATLSEPVSQG